MLGPIVWPVTASGVSASIQCPCERDSSLTLNIVALRMCSMGEWGNPDPSQCTGFESICNKTQVRTEFSSFVSVLERTTCDPCSFT